MKRFLHTPLRLLFSLLFLFSLSLPHLQAQPVMPQLSTDMEEHWYYIQFGYYKVTHNSANCGGLFLGDNGEGQALTFSFAGNFKSNKWKVIDADSLDSFDRKLYYLQSKNGLYLCGSNPTKEAYQFTYRSTSDIKAAQPVVLLDTQGNSNYLNYWQLQRANVKDSVLNANGSSTNVRQQMKEWKENDNGNFFMFVEAPAEEDANMLQFSLYGNLGLYDGGDGTVTAKKKEANDAAESYTWEHVGDCFYFKLRSGLGNYLIKNADGSVGTTAVENQATQFRYYPSNINDNLAARVELAEATKAGENLGQNGTIDALSLVDEETGVLRFDGTNRRQSCLRQTTEINGAELPVFSSLFHDRWYRIRFNDNPSHTTQRYFTLEDEEALIVDALHGEDATDQLWKLERYNANGDFFLVNQSGQYITNSGELFVATEQLQVGTTTQFRLLEDEKNRNGWQIYMSLSGETERTMGLKQAGEDEGAGTEEAIYTRPNGAAFNYLTFEEASNTITYKTRYIQFSGQGRVALYDDNKGTLSVETPVAEQPRDAGYRWEIRVNAAGDGFYLKSGNGNYVRYADGVFGLTDDEAQAQLFGYDSNTYFSNGQDRFNLFLYGDNTQVMGWKGGKLQLVPRNSRYSVVRIDENVKGPTYPKLSEEGSETWYNLRFTVNDQYVYDALPENNIKLITNPANNTDPLFLWAFVEENELGDIKLKSQAGSYARQVGLWYFSQGDASQATVLRLQESIDNTSNISPEDWHVRNVNTGSLMLISNDNNLGITSGAANPRSAMQFTEATSDYRYFLFPAMGLPLSDGGKASTDENENIAPRAYYAAIANDGSTNEWKIEYVGNVEFKLLSRNGNYLAYDNGFKTTKDSERAYRFKRQFNEYQNNNVFRYEFLSADGTQALSVTDAVTGELSWGQPGTRYSVAFMPYLLASPDLPRTSTSGSDFQLYYIRTDEGSHNVLATPNEAEPAESGDPNIILNAAKSSIDMHQLWSVIQKTEEDSSSIGDYYLQNAMALYLKYDAATGFTATANRNEASTVRLVETNSHYKAWQLQIVDVPDDNNIVRYNSSQNGLIIGSPNATEAYMRFVTADIYPEFYEADGGAWRQIRFDLLENTPLLDAAGGSVGEYTGNQATDTNLWKNIGTHRDFTLKNGAGTFLALDADNKLVLAEEENQAAHFYLWLSRANDDGTARWIICKLPADGEVPVMPDSCLADIDGNVQMVSFREYMNQPEITVTLTDKVTPSFSTPAKQYYNYFNFSRFPPNNLYLSDGMGHVVDAIAEPKQEVNDMMWAMIGTLDDLTLRSKNGDYLCWNPDNGTFDVTHEVSEAAHFRTSNAGGEDLGYFQLISGYNVSVEQKNKFLAVESRDGVYHVTLSDELGNACYISMTQFDIPEAEDYTAYHIVSKQSWFVKQAHDATLAPLTGFIQQDEEGFAENPYDGRQEQKTNTYTVTHYLKQGTARELYLPTCMIGSTGTYVNAYQRWYDYKTDERIPEERVILAQESRRDYANGTIMGNKLPANNAYGNYVTHSFTFQMPETTSDDYEYIVGMDASLFRDFVDYFGDNGNPQYGEANFNEVVLPDYQNLIEPTLSGRNLFVIRNARAMAKRLTACTEGSDQWLEEQTITFPKKKVTFTHSTFPLEFQLNDYWFYKNGEVKEENLQNITEERFIQIEAGENTAQMTGFETVNRGSVGFGGRRFIRFVYPGDPDGTAVATAAGDICEVRVYAVSPNDNGTTTRFQLAKVTLRFEDDVEPRYYKEVIGQLPNGDFVDDRSPEALAHRAGTPVATIDFDPEQFFGFVAPPFGQNTAFNQDNPSSSSHPLTYRYPLLFENSSYCFEPLGTSGDSYTGTGDTKENTWGSYTIARRAKMNWGGGGNYRPVKYLYQEEYGIDRYDASQAGFMYIDASELPGRIASLDFDGNLCPGSRLYVSAWISSPTSPGGGSAANVIFHVQGITEDNRTVNLYSYCPGGIFCDARLKNGGTQAQTGGGEGNWQQIAFNFINSSSEKIVRYVLNIDNACTTSAGGDIYLDDVQIFAVKPTVQLERSSPVCDQQILLTKMATDYDGLLQSIGLQEGDFNETDAPLFAYCLIDKEAYEAALPQDETGDEAQPDAADIQKAFLAALVGDPDSDDPETKAFRSVNFPTKFDGLEPYDYLEALLNTTGTAIRKEITSDGVRRLVVSDRVSGSSLRPNHNYYLVFRPLLHDVQISKVNAMDLFQWGTECCILSEFRSNSAIQVIGDGDDQAAPNDTLQGCAGKSIAVSVQMNGNSADGTAQSQIVPYDWWMDCGRGGCLFEEAYLAADGSLETVGAGQTPSAGAVSVREALQTFRHFHPDALTLQGTVPQQEENFHLTQAMIDGLDALTHSTAERDALLLLYNSTCNLTLSPQLTIGDVQSLTLIPIDHESEDGSVQYCYDPRRIYVQATGKAPTLYDGFHGEAYPYPAHLTNVPLRTSLAFVTGMARAATEDGQPTQYLRIPLRGMQVVNEQATGLQTIVPAGEDYAPIFLVGTNDPDQPVYENEGALTFRTIGRVKQLEANKDDEANAFADLYFLPSFTPREGYTYTLRVNFEEQFSGGNIPEDATAVCEGSLVADLKIVPQYLVWTGEAGNTDWTNDQNWRRASRAELHFDAATETAYTDNEANGTDHGFVPLDHTSVVLAAEPAVQPALYAVANGAARSFLDFDAVAPDGLRTATADIEFDLIPDPAQQGADGVTEVLCLPFYTYQAKDVVLQSGAELLRADLLGYDRAWMEYSLSPDRWYTLGSPLQATYAGDWYAPTDGGRQATPYFHDVTFDDAKYDRFSPAVYQRSWDKGKATLYYLDPYTDTPAQGQTAKDKDVYLRATWSKVYNDVQESYAAGGFSVKAAGKGKGENAYAQTLFRLPKEDTQFQYFTADGGTDGAAHEVDRKGAHKFYTDALTDAGAFTQTVTNAEAGNAYFLVSNPLPCGLDMRAFFAANPGLEKKYWLLTEQGQTAALQDGNSWVTINDDASTQTAAGVLAPGQGFFVKAAQAPGGGQLTLTYDAGMMTSARAASATLRAGDMTAPFAASGVLRIRATRDGETSEAIVQKTSDAENAFRPTEDLETLADDNLRTAPTVYTLAGTQAATVNRRGSMYRVPLGLVSDNDSTVRLTFSGMRSFGETLSLLDDRTGAVTPLTLAAGTADTVSVEVEGCTAGRYFIVSSEAPSLEDELTDCKPWVSVNDSRVTITANAAHPLTYLHIVCADGRTLYTMTPYAHRLTLKLPAGLYVVDARTASQSTTVKISVP